MENSQKLLPYRRFSKAQAAEVVKEIAAGFISKQDTKGRSFRLGPASSDRIGKGGSRWTVPVYWAENEAEIDGPSLLVVELSTGETKWLVP